jgi:nitrilase
VGSNTRRPNSSANEKERFTNKDEWVNPGDAVVYKPFGGIVAGPMHRKKGFRWADIDVSAARTSRQKFDASGHYSRPDVFSLSVDRSRKVPVSFS